MRGVANGGVGPLPIWPGFSDGIVGSECAGSVGDPEGTDDNDGLDVARFSESSGSDQDTSVPVQ